MEDVPFVIQRGANLAISAIQPLEHPVFQVIVDQRFKLPLFFKKHVEHRNSLLFLRCKCATAGRAKKIRRAPGKDQSHALMVFADLCKVF